MSEETKKTRGPRKSLEQQLREKVQAANARAVKLAKEAGEAVRKSEEADRELDKLRRAVAVFTEAPARGAEADD